MSRVCAIKSCTTTRKDEITFHVVPRDVKDNIRWQRVLDPVQLAKCKNATVCAKHFVPDDFRYDKNGVKLLVPVAYPSEHLVSIFRSQSRARIEHNNLGEFFRHVLRVNFTFDDYLKCLLP